MISNMRLAVDVGGTFTDLVLLGPDMTAVPKKILSTPDNFSVAVRQAIRDTLLEQGVNSEQVGEYIHGATVATNAIITRTGARTGLITNQGFRDVLEIRRLRMNALYDLRWEKPPPLVPRHLRLEVPGRMDHKGSESTLLNEEQARRVIQQLIDEGVESIAVCYLHSYANSIHERRTAELIQELAPETYVSLSSRVLPEIKEYERTSTTVINAYVQPVVDKYFQSMEGDLREIGINTPVMVMQSNGGMMPMDTARTFPVHIIESGPAAGVTGVYHLAQRLGIEDAMSLDIGGTTAKAALIEHGEIARSPEYEVGGGVSIGHSLVKGGGYLLRVPSVDLAEVGAGGGSIALADEAGALKVGPQSAGADPGPACYGRGGQMPTITDANVHLGLTSPEGLAGGALTIRPDLAERAIFDRVARPLGLELTEAAWGIRTVANSSLIRALRAVSTERGRDPRRFTLFAFGGMGPVHALDLANELGIVKVIVPPLPGLFSSLGLLFAEVEHHFIQSHYATTEGMDYDKTNEVIDRLANDAISTLTKEGYDEKHRAIQFSVDIRYLGQDYALTIPMKGCRLSPSRVDELVEDFEREHNQTYGYRSGKELVQCVAFRCLARGISNAPRVPENLQVSTMQGWHPSGDRLCYFGPKVGWTKTEVIGRYNLGNKPKKGPMIIEEDNSLTVVLPGWCASLDEWSNIVLDRG